MFFCEDFNAGEEWGKAGTLQLALLLVFVALGDEDEAVALIEVLKGFVDAGKELDFLVGDGVDEGDDAVVLVFGDGGVRELLEAGNQGAVKAFETVTVRGDGGMFAEVEMFADFFVGVDAVVEVGDERGDGALEVDVVFPEGVVGVEEEGLGGFERQGGRGGGHCLIVVGVAGGVMLVSADGGGCAKGWRLAG